jgi:hypothetical protein
VSWTRDLIDGMARHLAAAGVGVYRESGIYGTNEVAITDTSLPLVDRAVTLTAYDTADSDRVPDVTVMVQVRTRGRDDPREVADLDDAVYEALHGLRTRHWGTATVLLIRRDSAAVLGPDSQGRHERTSNYIVRALRPLPDAA